MLAPCHRATPREASPPGRNHPAIGLLQAALSGVAYGLAFPPDAIRPVAWVALVPLFLALRRASWPMAMLLGAVWTIVATWMVGDCLPGAVVSYYGQPLALGYLLLLAVTLVTAVPYYALFAACYASLAGRFTTTLPLLAGAAWSAAELGRVEGVIGDPWGVAGYSQASLLPLAQVAELTGVYGMSFLVAAVNAALAALWWALRAPRPQGADRSADVSSALRGGALVGGLVVLVAAYGAARLAGAPPLRSGPARALASFRAPGGGSTAIPAALIQGNLDLGSQWRPQHYGRNLEAYLRLTMAALGRSEARLVFWPESAMTFFVETEPAYQRSIASAIGPWRAELVAGGPRRVGSADDPIYLNSTFVIAPDGSVTATYDKQRLLPFAEYFPSSILDFMRRDFGSVREFAPGTSIAPIPTTAGRAGVIICNEAMFPGPATARVKAGAQYLLNPSNDSWMGDIAFSLQVFDIVRLRAIEQRRTLVRTSTSGPSAIVDPFGRVDAYAEPMTGNWIAGSISPRDGLTPYARLGDLFAYACLVAAVVAWVVAVRGAATRTGRSTA